MSPARRSLLAGGLVAGLITLPLALVIAPADAVQGEAQRWMYLHVPAAWSAFLCFGAVLVASVRHAFAGGARPLALARAAAEVGVLLTAQTLLTGSIWGALTWGTWWAWDARVISTVAMGLVYVVYLAATGLAHGPRGRLAVDAVGIFGFATVPVVHFSVLWWRTLHQPPTILTPSLNPPIEPVMAAVLACAVVTFTLLAAWAVLRRAADPRVGHGEPAPPAGLPEAWVSPVGAGSPEPAPRLARR